jgi:hypothetical protein
MKKAASAIEIGGVSQERRPKPRSAGFSRSASVAIA